MALVQGDGGGRTGMSITDILNSVTGATKSIGTALQNNAQQKQNDLLSQLANGLGSGSGSGVDHFFDINPLDQAMFDQNVKQQDWQNEFDLTQFNWQKANDDRDYALAVGDLDLARQKQADANYWQGKSYELEQQRMALDERMNSADNATRTNIAQMEAASRAETARIAAQADKYSADLRLQEGLANATNDQERNRVLLAHEQELAAIAKMEDETKRMIAAGDQKIGGFNAETARMAQMGDVALKNNQFLLDASKSPRDLFGLYFMQRGITPDWDSLAAGNPTQGEGLKVYDPMKAYNPNITMPQDFEMANGSSFGNVGNASNIGLNANPFIQMGMQQTQQQPQAQPQPQQQPQPIMQPPPPITFSGWGTPSFANGTDFPMQQQKPGYTRAPMFMTGDNSGGNPWGGGAKPEMIENPTQAPIRVKNTMQTAADFGVMPQQPSARMPQAGGTDAIIAKIMQLLMQQRGNNQRFANGTDFGVPRYPIGTDLSQQYANMGMSQLWQNSSNNEHLQGIENIPTWLQTLADYGTPIAPSLANSVTGGVSPTLNLASAFNQRGGGILPSLQTLNKQSAGENQLFQGYLEGPVGMPAQDTLDFIGRPTQNLRTAQRSSAIMN